MSISWRVQAGFTLIELVIFIVVISLLSVGLFSVFVNTLKGVDQLDVGTQAMQLAIERMELIMPQRHALGFAGFTGSTFDPCTSTPTSTQAVCTAIPAGYTITTQLATSWLSDTNYKVVTVTVAGKGQATLQALVANY
ncbi:MAG: prepilin-type N-terminal cleavage/methylation domain-containing protein, partial [Pseudomonadota bacterium]